MPDLPPIILWLRRDLRLADHPALTAAIKTGQPVIPLWIYDECTQALGAAPKWRMGLAVEHFAQTLNRIGSRLILRCGDALQILQDVIAETGATHVHWSRAYDPQSIARDKIVKATLKDHGITAQSFPGHLLFEPWTVETKAGGFFKVYTPFWNTVRRIDVPEHLRAPTHLTPPAQWPISESLDDWHMGAAMHCGVNVVKRFTCVGEAAALERLNCFTEKAVDRYKQDRDFPALNATSRLSENLTYGEISPRTIYHAGRAALEHGAKGAEHFIKELVWREFAYHLVYHTPYITEQNWRPEWNDFPWRDDNEDAEHWRRGLTGEPFVDAGMRELYVTGTLHNRMRMIVGSYLTKHLMTHWKIGLDWFADTLIDWDPASNAMGWQWVAGCGPDAAPYFRVFNPETQAEKFDAKGFYRTRFLPSMNGNHHQDAELFYKAIPAKWGLDLNDTPPKKRIDLKSGRERALAAYAAARS